MHLVTIFILVGLAWGLEGEVLRSQRREILRAKRKVQMVLADLDRQLDAAKLSTYAARLSVALDNCFTRGRSNFPMVDYPSDEIERELMAIMRYCLRHRTLREAWFHDFNKSGLLSQLVRVIRFIPFGYHESSKHVDSWAVVHRLLRELLREDDVKCYGVGTSGYTTEEHAGRMALHAQGMGSGCPVGPFPAELSGRAEIITAWNYHLYEKDYLEDNYRHKSEDWYQSKFERYKELHGVGDHSQERIAY